MSIQAPYNATANGISAYTGNGAAQPQTIDEAAKAFEQIFISQMLSQMFTGIESDGLFSGGQSEKIYQSLMIEEYGSVISERGGIGIADALKRQLLENQEVAK